MPNEKNLIPMDRRSQSEARELGREGGIASGAENLKESPKISNIKKGAHFRESARKCEHKKELPIVGSPLRGLTNLLYHGGNQNANGNASFH